MDGLGRAAEYARQALRIDPRFAPAYALLGESQISYAWYGGARTADVVPVALDAVQQGLALNGDSAEVHVAMARLARLDGDWDGHLNQLQQAVRLDPANGDALRNLGLHHLWTGNITDAERYMHRAYELDPVSIPGNVNLGETLFYSRQYERAAEQYRKTIDMDPTYFWTHERLGEAYLQMGLFDEAITEYRKATGLGGSPRMI
jgi:tetratricopeptide (TPR) repeat protein